MIEPDFPHIMLSFEYTGWKVEIDKGEMSGYPTYAVWANDQLGCVVAVPYASSRQEAIKLAKQWIDDQNNKNRT